MKQFLIIKLIAALLLIAGFAQAGGKKPVATSDLFVDRVKIIRTTAKGYQFRFEVHTKPYTIQRKHPEFGAIRAKLERSLKENKTIKVLVQIPSREITKVDEVRL